MGHPGASFILAALLWWLAWKLAPHEGGDAFWWLPAGIYAAVGLIAALTGLRQSRPTPSPFRSPRGRILWALRPRGWMVVLAGLAATIWWFGTPHLIMRYPAHVFEPRACLYLGIGGFRRLPLQGDGSMNGCRILVMAGGIGDRTGP